MACDSTWVTARKFRRLSHFSVAYINYSFWGKTIRRARGLSHVTGRKTRRGLSRYRYKNTKGCLRRPNDYINHSVSGITVPKFRGLSHVSMAYTVLFTQFQVWQFERLGAFHTSQWLTSITPFQGRQYEGVSRTLQIGKHEGVCHTLQVGKHEGVSHTLQVGKHEGVSHTLQVAKTRRGLPHITGRKIRRGLSDVPMITLITPFRVWQFESLGSSHRSQWLTLFTQLQVWQFENLSASHTSQWLTSINHFQVWQHDGVSHVRGTKTRKGLSDVPMITLITPFQVWQFESSGASHTSQWLHWLLHFRYDSSKV